MRRGHGGAVGLLAGGTARHVRLLAVGLFVQRADRRRRRCASRALVVLPGHRGQSGPVRTSAAGSPGKTRWSGALRVYGACSKRRRQRNGTFPTGDAAKRACGRADAGVVLSRAFRGHRDPQPTTALMPVACAQPGPRPCPADLFSCCWPWGDHRLRPCSFFVFLPVRPGAMGLLPAQDGRVRFLALRADRLGGFRIPPPRLVARIGARPLLIGAGAAPAREGPVLAVAVGPSTARYGGRVDRAGLTIGRRPDCCRPAVAGSPGPPSVEAGPPESPPAAQRRPQVRARDPRLAVLAPWPGRVARQADPRPTGRRGAGRPCRTRPYQHALRRPSTAPSGRWPGRIAGASFLVNAHARDPRPAALT